MKRPKKGFTLIEILVAVSVFILFAMGIYAGLQFTFKSVYFSRVRIIETGILNEQLEIIRNMSFFDVGILNGSPSGLLERTVTTTRNNIDFTITRTIRDIDDPFDGVIGGGVGGASCGENKVYVCHSDNTLCINENALPAHQGHGDVLGQCGAPVPSADTAPTDYKLVQIDIICDHCAQQNAVSMSTFIAPKYLEGDPTHGALFIEVLDANIEPLQGVEVHIVSTSTIPTYDFFEITDNDGMLRVVDLAAGIGSYQISVTKDGFTTDSTNDTVMNPVKPPASVIAQDVSTISFFIDEASTIDITTTNNFCTAVPSVSLNVVGADLIGTNPDTHRIDGTVSTNGSGTATLANYRWDVYSFLAPSFDIIGAIPHLPLSLSPGTVQPLQLILGSNTNHSLLVHVLDNSNGQPISEASVRLTEGGAYDQTKITGVGHFRQTDWSGGLGQLEYIFDNKYWTDNGGVEELGSVGDVTLEQVGENYVPSGILESSIIDLGTGVDFVELSWEPFAQPPETGASSLKFQIATSATSTPASWDYVGYDGTAGTYYDENNFSTNAGHNSSRYLRYKVYLGTADTAYTPTLSDLSISYTTSCTPPGQAYFGSLSDAEYTAEVTAVGYQVYSSAVNVSGETFFTANLIAQ